LGKSDDLFPEEIYLVNFRGLQFSLLELVRRKIRNGVVTERGLARLSGLSQPHIHNTLGNIRTLSIESTDRIMTALNITVGDLLGAPAGHAEADFTFTAVPFLNARIGPGSQPVFDSFRGFLPVVSSLAAGLVLPVAARLAHDLVLPRSCAARDIVLLDQNPAARVRPLSGVWVISDDAFGMRVRYTRLIGSLLFVFHEANFADPVSWATIPLAGKNILDIVRARIVWIGRELEKDVT
jgi:hypothetical protein